MIDVLDLLVRTTVLAHSQVIHSQKTEGNGLGIAIFGTDCIDKTGKDRADSTACAARCRREFCRPPPPKKKEEKNKPIVEHV